MIVRVARQASLSGAQDVVVAVDDEEVLAVVRNAAAVKQFFREAARADKPIVAVFNQCDLEGDREFWPQWLATFAGETGAEPELVYVAPRDREATTRAKVLSNTIKQKRKEKAGRWDVPVPKVRAISEDEMFRVVRTGKRQNRRMGMTRGIHNQHNRRAQRHGKVGGGSDPRHASAIKKANCPFDHQQLAPLRCGPRAQGFGAHRPTIQRNRRKAGRCLMELRVDIVRAAFARRNINSPITQRTQKRQRGYRFPRAGGWCRNHERSDHSEDIRRRSQ